MKRPFHKMTSKASKAVEIYAQMYGVEQIQVRKDHAAIHGIYAELEDRGFEWVAGKQEWALISGGAPADEILRLTIAVDDSQQAAALYILEEGFKAAGFELLGVQREEVFMSPIAATIIFYLQVKL